MIALTAAGCSVQGIQLQPYPKPSASAPTKAAGPVKPAPAIPRADLQFAAADPATRAFYVANGWQAAWSPDAAKVLNKAMTSAHATGSTMSIAVTPERRETPLRSKSNGLCGFRGRGI